MTTGTTNNRWNLRTGPGKEYAWKITLGAGVRLEDITIVGDWVKCTVPTLGLSGYVARDGVVVDIDPAVVNPVNTGSLAALVPLTPLKPPGDELIDLNTARTGDERRVINTWNRYGGYIRALSEVAQIDPLAAVATFAVESGANAYDAHGRMIIRVEAHLLYDKAGINGRSTWARFFTMASNRRWEGHTARFLEGGTRIPYHGNNAMEWEVLAFAGSLWGQENAARSTSFGLAQVLGSNFGRLGYTSGRQMLEAMQASTHRQIAGFFDYCKLRLFPAIRARDWQTFAAGYNGTANVPVYSRLLASSYAAAVGRIHIPTGEMVAV